MKSICVICKTGEIKYKCPSCLVKYCSKLCYQSHKGSCVLVVSKDDNNDDYMRQLDMSDGSRRSYRFETEDTVSLEKLRILDSSEGLKQVLKNPHVRDMLLAVDRAENPALAMQAAMLEPIFVEFADECLRVIEPRTKNDDFVN